MAAERWKVSGKLLGKPKGDGGPESKKSKDVSGIACATTNGFPRVCLLADDESQGAQVVILKQGKLIAGDFIRLIYDTYNNKPLELDADVVWRIASRISMSSVRMGGRATKRM